MSESEKNKLEENIHKLYNSNFCFNKNAYKSVKKKRSATVREERPFLYPQVLWLDPRIKLKKTLERQINRSKAYNFYLMLIFLCVW